MADDPDPNVESAAKAYEAKLIETQARKAPLAPVPAPVEAKVPKPVPAQAKARKASPKKKAAAARRPSSRKQTSPKTFAATSTVSDLKEKIMATAKTTDFTKPINEAIGEFQTRAKAAYEKGSEALTEATEFAKGNVEAYVESAKIFAAGAQTLGKSYVEEAKSAYETLTADVKELAAVKSPTELFQLQGKIMRRNFDAFVANGSKNTDAVLKLASEAFAPITGRVNVAAEKLGKVA
jgi:phasin family protein